VAGVEPDDESRQARATADQYNLPFSTFRAELDEELLRIFFHRMQRPTIDGLNTLLVSRSVRDSGRKVALSGLGGDEALGGYRHYRLLKMLPLLTALDHTPLPTHAFAKIATRLGPGQRSKTERLFDREGPRDSWGLSLLQRELFPATEVAVLTGIDPASSLVPSGHGGIDSGDLLSLVRAEVALYLQSMLLPDADSFSMAWSVELRVPFVDVQLFSSAIAIAKGSQRRVGKRQFCQALGDPYLSSVERRPKRGFSVPMSQWLDNGPLRRLVDEAADPDAAVWHWVDRDTALPILTRRPRTRWSEVWSLTALNEWLRSVAGDVPRD
jgi:asparagine synthase (glutamine-hydrolysing)